MDPQQIFRAELIQELTLTPEFVVKRSMVNIWLKKFISEKKDSDGELRVRYINFDMVSLQ